MLPRNAITLCWTLSLAAGCSAQPVLPPQVVPCPPPRISPELLVPPETQAINRLLRSLGMPEVSVGETQTGFGDSRPR